jgi:membrane-bound lytic murein transglycosylase D
LYRFFIKTISFAFVWVILLLVGSPATAFENVVRPKDRINPTVDFSTGTGSWEQTGDAGGPREPTFTPEFGDTRIRASVEPVQPQEPQVEKVSLSPQLGIPLVFNDAVERYITYFSTTKKDVFRAWLKRKRLYEPLVTRVLKQYGLPEDLIYLAMIESGFNPRAHSPMDADGPWQFVAETGKRYGLVVNHWVDERRDVEKSTVAAARYLQQLFDQFDSWYLAAAAYNAGENKIDRLIKRHDTKDFWHLSTFDTLPRETRGYVPQLIAAAILSKNPEKYGFEDMASVTPLRFVGQTVPGGVALSAVAKAASTDINVLKSLNPELLTDITPPGKECPIKLPAGTIPKKFRIALALILKKEKRVVGVIDHVIKGQEDVSHLTKKYGVSAKELVMVNDSPLDLKKGELVYIPQFSSRVTQ